MRVWTEEELSKSDVHGVAAVLQEIKKERNLRVSVPRRKESMIKTILDIQNGVFVGVDRRTIKRGNRKESCKKDISSGVLESEHSDVVSECDGVEMKHIDVELERSGDDVACGNVEIECHSPEAQRSDVGSDSKDASAAPEAEAKSTGENSRCEPDLEAEQGKRQSVPVRLNVNNSGYAVNSERLQRSAGLARQGVRSQDSKFTGDIMPQRESIYQRDGLQQRGSVFHSGNQRRVRLGGDPRFSAYKPGQSEAGRSHTPVFPARSAEGEDERARTVRVKRIENTRTYAGQSIYDEVPARSELKRTYAYRVGYERGGDGVETSSGYDEREREVTRESYRRRAGDYPSSGMYSERRREVAFERFDEDGVMSDVSRPGIERGIRESVCDEDRVPLRRHVPVGYGERDCVNRAVDSDENFDSYGRDRVFSSSSVEEVSGEEERREELFQSSDKREGNYVTGVLELLDGGSGILRGRTYKKSDNDVFVGVSLVKNCKLRMGDVVTGTVRSNKRGECRWALVDVLSINGQTVDEAKHRPVFDNLVPVFPDERFVLETEPTEYVGRIIDLLAPIGKGQRALIVSPPKAGKTITLKKIAQGILRNNPEVKLMALLVDERPEEVTDMERSISGEVIASTFDETPEQHVQICKLVMERARRLVELGQDVVIIFDSLTRLGRACNNCTTNSGRTMSGGLDISALRVPKQFFGSARNVENGGSLTIVATALIETGSKMDEVIFEEFKSTGNMEVNLSRKLAERRVFPAIDVRKSSTRHDECLLDNDVWMVGSAVRRIPTATQEGEREPIEKILDIMNRITTNKEFCAYLLQQMGVKRG